VILNPRSGTVLAMGLTPEVLQEHFQQEGHEVTIDAGEDPMLEKLERARNSAAEVIVAAGGDGTATAIAGAILGTGKSLAFIPLGTINLLARDLGLPFDIPKWVAELDAMEPQLIDVGEVNGKIFLHKVVIGLIPGIAAGREKIRGLGGIGAQLGFLRYFFRRLVRARRMAIEIKYRSGETRIERVLSVAVANNGYDEGLGRFFSRERLDGDSLTLYIIKHLTPGDVFRLVLEMLLGTWRQDEALQIESVRSVTIRTRKQVQKVMIDGEIEAFNVPLNFSIRPAALPVLAPVPVEAPPVTDPAVVALGTGA
jgi:diacylglycerol kinase family enzyme